MGVPGGAAAMTVEACIAACAAAGYQIAGVEWSQECCESRSSSFIPSHSSPL